MKIKHIIRALFFLSPSFGGLGGALYAQENLTPEAYREKVLSYSRQLLQAKEGTQAATAGKKIAYKGYLPKLDFNASGSLDFKELEAWSGAEGEYRNHTYNGQLNLTQSLYAGGALKAQNNIAQREVELSMMTEELTIDQISYQADAAYWSASANLALFSTAQVFYEIVKKQYNVINDRFQDGMISRTDLLMISTRLKEAELQLIIARKNYTLSMQSLHILMGIEPNAPNEITVPINSQQPKAMLLPLEEVLIRRADYQSTGIDIEKQEFMRKLSLSKFNPQLGMQVSGGWGTATPNFGRKPDFAALAAVNLNVPILRWGERKQTNVQNKALINIKRLQQSATIDNINLELSGAWAKVTQSEQQVFTAEENTSLAQENLDLVSFSYNEGKASIVDVLSAQLSWIQAQSNVISAFLSHKLALAEYRKVISE